MNIKELCKLTRKYESNLTNISLRTSDLDFYTLEWKRLALKKELETLNTEQSEIKAKILSIAPSIEFN